jgi:hypothetical protein
MEDAARTCLVIIFIPPVRGLLEPIAREDEEVTPLPARAPCAKTTLFTLSAGLLGSISEQIIAEQSDRPKSDTFSFSSSLPTAEDRLSNLTDRSRVLTLITFWSNSPVNENTDPAEAAEFKVNALNGIVF